jgi:hypothetical protein
MIIYYPNGYSYSTPCPHPYVKNPVSRVLIVLGEKDVVSLEQIKNSAFE